MPSRTRKILQEYVFYLDQVDVKAYIYFLNSKGKELVPVVLLLPFIVKDLSAHHTDPLLYVTRSLLLSDLFLCLCRFVSSEPFLLYKLVELTLLTVRVP